VGYLLLHQNIKAVGGERLRLEIFIYPPDLKKRDIDNVCKAILDALQHGGLYADDFYIQQLYVERREVRKHGEIEFILRSI
jgi:crossover junction endodeoxyribonuclease RusA